MAATAKIVDKNDPAIIKYIENHPQSAIVMQRLVDKMHGIPFYFYPIGKQSVLSMYEDTIDNRLLIAELQLQIMDLKDRIRNIYLFCINQKDENQALINSQNEQINELKDKIDDLRRKVNDPPPRYTE